MRTGGWHEKKMSRGGLTRTNKIKDQVQITVLCVLLTSDNITQMTVTLKVTVVIIPETEVSHEVTASQQKNKGV